ncbi:NAD(P)-binding protein [Daedalea quercina L-15889]|uniref:NAD(P)-binding protein n=1 Tax=Daedalea quercina L-15889 TaxID=1314783 RepID=A0A165RJL3_9APHY|nr:NAD(P)-binding protein [Daedalea quercina L-15889]
MVVKSCLKRSTGPPSSSAPEPSSYEGLLLPSSLEQSQPIREARRKSVTFSDDGNEEEVKEEVFYVEEYDRSPMKVTNKLNYRRIDPRGALKDSYKGKSVLVTGAGRGIGKAVAFAFALAGAANIVLTARSKFELESAREEILSEPHRVVANMEANVNRTYLLIHYLLKGVSSTNTVAPHPITILCTTLVGGLVTHSGFSGYGTSKTAINRFAEFLHAEYGGKGVRAFAYHPGGVLTKLAKHGMPPETHNTLFIDTPELAGGFSVLLSTPEKYADTDVFRGRYVSCNWDVEDMVKKGREISGTEAEARWLLMKLVI